MSPRDHRIDAVVFDFDGTLTEPGALSFAAIREAIGCPAGEPILEFLAALPDAGDRDRRMRVLESLELKAAAASLPSRGAETAVLAVRERGLPVAILSRNELASIERALANFPRITLDDFDLVLTRESPARPKPAPDGLLLAARRLHVEPTRMLVVGDYQYDLQAGRAAGAVTVLVKNGGGTDHGWDYDFAIDTLGELPDLMDRRVLLPAGGSPATRPTSRHREEAAGA